MTHSRSLEMNFEPFSCLALNQLKQPASDGDNGKTWQPAGSSIWMTSMEAAHLGIWPRFHLWIVRSKRRKKMRMHFLLCMSFEWHLPKFVFLAETSCKRPAFKCISKLEVFVALGICTWLVIWLYLLWPLMVLLLQMQWLVFWLMTIWTVLWVGTQNCGRKVAQPGPMGCWPNIKVKHLDPDTAAPVLQLWLWCLGAMDGSKRSWFHENQWKSWHDFGEPIAHFYAQGLSAQFIGQALQRRQTGSTQGSVITTPPQPESSYMDPCVTTDCPAICWKTWDEHACVICEGEVVHSCYRVPLNGSRLKRIEEPQGIEWYWYSMFLTASCEFELTTCIELRAWSGFGLMCM